MPETVTLVRSAPGARDALGVPAEDPSPGEVPIHGAEVAVGAVSEITAGQSTDGVELTVFLPAGSPVPLATDQMRARGELFEVLGRGADWSASDPVAGVVVELGRAR